MSRKTADKSNTPKIGIFTDKKSSRYNELTLEALLVEELSAWRIAEILKEKIAKTGNKETIIEKRYRTQKIYSVIQRKSGRLIDLKTKGYIIDDNGKWRLSTKGIIALSIAKPELVSNKLQKEIKEQFIKIFNEMPAEITMGMKIEPFNIEPFIERINQTKELELILEEAKSLLLLGIELDRISEKDLVGLVKARESFKEKIEKMALFEE
jgi:hypothetical protein